MTHHPSPNPQLAAAAISCIDSQLTERPNRLVVIGLCGSQGSGKSTLADWIAHQYQQQGVPGAVLSLDDLYLPRDAREALARDVHPLLRTRGVPGTHDVALGLSTLHALKHGEPAPLPRFDKARDDRRPMHEWPRAPVGCRLLIFEGWCVGARPQAYEQLAAPLNELERTEDATGDWRRYANDALIGRYQDLFASIDALLLLAAPDFDVVLEWRMQQEAELRARVGADAPGVMDAAALARFVSHYERLTRHILQEMPGRADLVARLDRQRGVTTIERRGA